MPFQVNELLSLLVAVLLVPALIITARHVETPGRRLFSAAFAAVLVSFAATNAEAVMLPEVMNVVEHAAIALAGVLLAFASMGLLKQARSEGEEP